MPQRFALKTVRLTAQPEDPHEPSEREAMASTLGASGKSGIITLMLKNTEPRISRMTRIGKNRVIRGQFQVPFPG